MFRKEDINPKKEVRDVKAKVGSLLMQGVQQMDEQQQGTKSGRFSLRGPGNTLK